jgi:hypothetical protein
MKKRNFNPLAVASLAVAVLLAAASCTKTDELSGVTNKGYNITTLTASCANGSGSSAEAGTAQTKVTYTPSGNIMKVSWHTGDFILLANATQAPGTYVKFNYKGTDGAQSGTFTIEDGKTLSASNGDKIIAYYTALDETDEFTIGGTWPGDGTLIFEGDLLMCNDMTSLSEVPGTGNTQYNDSGLPVIPMYATATYNGGVASLSFAKTCALLKATVTGGAAGSKLSSLYFISKDGGEVREGSLSLSGSSASWTPKSFGYNTRFPFINSKPKFETSFTFYYVIIPQTLSNMMMLFVPDSGTPLYMQLSDSKAFEAGNVYRTEKAGTQVSVLDGSGNLTGTSDVWYLQSGAINYLSTKLADTYASDNTKRITVFDDNNDNYGNSVELTGKLALGTCIFMSRSKLVDNTFSGCTNLAHVDMPLISTIGKNSFKDCTSLTVLNLPAANSVGDYAFEGCTGLTKVILGYYGSHVDTWGTEVFKGVPTGNIDLIVCSSQSGVSGNNMTCGSTTYTFKSITKIQSD